MTTTSPHLQRPDLVLPADLPGLREVVSRLLGAGGWPMHWVLHDTCPDCGGKARGYRKGGDGEFYDYSQPALVADIRALGFSWWACRPCRGSGHVNRNVLPLEFGFGTMAAVDWLVGRDGIVSVLTPAEMLSYFYDENSRFAECYAPGWDWSDDGQWGEDAYTDGKLPDGREVNGVEALRRLCLFSAGLPFKNDEEK